MDLATTYMYIAINATKESYKVRLTLTSDGGHTIVFEIEPGRIEWICLLFRHVQ